MTSDDHTEPRPLDSLKEFRRHLDEALAKARERGTVSDDGESEGPGQLARAFDLLRFYASPHDRADWNVLERARRHRERMNVGQFESLFASLGRWEFIGPRRFDEGGGHYVSGRVNAIAIDPVDSAILYAGAAGGGVWKSTDNGITWRALSNDWAYQEVSSIAIDPKNTAVLYVGTGDFQAGGPRYFGLMKSTDAGNSFVNIPAGEAADVSISAIVVDPDDSSVVTMCGGRGATADGFVWRSTDSGATWTRAFNIGANWSKVIIGKDDGTGKRAMYAVGCTLTRSLMYRSLDRGVNWESLTPPWRARQLTISVASSPLDAGRVYVLAGSDRKVFTSSDYGDTWSDVTDDLTLTDSEWVQVMYDWDIACGTTGFPMQHDIVFVGLIHLNLWDSKRRAWTVLPNGHADIHCLAIDPSNPKRGVLIGNDGGVYEQEQVAHGWDLSSRNATLGITQCYRGHASPFDARICLAGTADNAIASSQTDLTAWDQVFPLRNAGDSLAALINPANEKIQFAGTGVGFHGIARTKDQWKTSTDITPKLTTDFTDLMSLPLAMDSLGSHLYWASDYLWIRDEGTGSWRGHISIQKLAGKGNAVRALAVAPTDAGRVYTGSTDGQLWMAQGPDWVWTRIDAGLPIHLISAIAVHPLDKNDIVVALGGTGSSHLWRCRDTTAKPPKWEDVSGTGAGALPDLPAVGVVRDAVFAEDRYYAALDIGVFYTEDGGKHWIDITVTNGLPNVQLSDLQYVAGRIYAFTFGRGVWRLKPSINPA